MTNGKKVQPHLEHFFKTFKQSPQDNPQLLDLQKALTFVVDTSNRFHVPHLLVLIRFSVNFLATPF